MKACEEVIVTLIIQGKNPKKTFEEKLDMELPSFMPWKELSKKILECLKESKSDKYAFYYYLYAKHNGRKFTDMDTLASLGIWDGSIIECEVK